MAKPFFCGAFLGEQKSDVSRAFQKRALSCFFFGDKEEDHYLRYYLK
ncbi:MAG: hypothetical protein SO119_04020 [Phascolarctobacterium sp.]|nr:hypothetical protein [Phascolarctobacterium sp.]